MRRREVLRLCVGAGSIPLAGCTSGDDGATDTPTETPTPTNTPTETQTATASPTTPSTGTPTDTLGRVEYTVTNDDDESHQVEVTLTTADGTVVKETTKSLSPEESVSVASTGNDPERGPYELTVSLPSNSLTVELKLTECPAYNFGISVTPDGTLSVEREVCQK